jgi:beta-lactamase regulating signal transducer with metallopeptidase domain
MWLVLIIIFLVLLIIGFISENSKLKGQLESREYERKVLENRLKQFEK